MGFEDKLRRVEGHVAEARRMVHRQKGLIVRLRTTKSLNTTPLCACTGNPQDQIPRVPQRRNPAA
jgi:hypothetical protein